MTHVNKLLLLLAAVFALCMAAPCMAASTRGEVFLEGPTITIGDLFLDAGDKAGTEVSAAPAPGKKVVYDVTALRQVAESVSLSYTPSGNYERVTIIRASEALKNSEILDMVRAEITRAAPNKDFDLSLDNHSLEIHRPKNEKMNPKLVDFSLDPIKNRFEGTLLIDRTASQDAEVIKIAGRAMPTVEVGILATNLPAGSAIGNSDIEWRRVPQDKAGADALTDPSKLAGLETRRSLSAGTLLRLRDVRGARLVTKGSVVSIVIETASMQLAAQGRALNDAEYGETVRVVNTQSNRTIDAVVTGSNKVSAALSSGVAHIAAR